MEGLQVEETKNYFTELYAVNVSDKIEKKNGLSYLSWAWAWAELKKRHPEANYKVYENADGWNYFHDGKTAWVKTGVTASGVEHIEYLPVMDHMNKSIPLSAITSFAVNKAIQRSLTKAIGRHGLGLSIYAGEDLPEAEEKHAPTRPAVDEFANISAQLESLIGKKAFEHPENVRAVIAQRKIDKMKEALQVGLKNLKEAQ